MATIIKIERKSGVRYKALIRDNIGRVITSKTFDRKKDAKQWSSKVEGNSKEKAKLKARSVSPTLNQIAERYISQWEGKDPYLPSRIDYWTSKLGNKRITEITSELLQDTLDCYARGKVLIGNGVGRTKSINKPRAAATVVRMKSAISTVLTYAMKHKIITENPVRCLDLPKVDNARVRWLSDDERKRLVGACKQSTWDKLYLIVLLALTTGARKGELLNLRWSDIDFKNNTALLRTTKNGQPRTLTFPSPAIKELNNHRQIGKSLVFSAKTKDTPFCFREHWIKALEKAAINDFKFHDLRHTAASYLVMNGATLYETGEILGHKSTETTKRYAHLSTKHKAELTESILGKTMSEY